MLDISTKPTVGTFVKTDSPQVVEVLGTCGLDYLVLDAEHAPFDRNTMDRMLLAARAAGLPMLVRVPDHGASAILSALDLGAVGIVVPHVESADQAGRVVAAARYIGGRRGYSASPRAGGYGSKAAGEVIAQGDQSIVICQIESGAAVSAAEEIAAVAGVTALFIGRADLALSLGAHGLHEPSVVTAVRQCIKAARRRSRAVMMAVDQEADLGLFGGMGAQSFVFASDQGLLRRTACQLPRQLANQMASLSITPGEDEP